MFKIFMEEIFEIEWINYGIARDVQDYWIRNFRRLIQQNIQNLTSKETDCSSAFTERR